nr:DUF4421 family protein [uncultured Capnocytophaga sp.]
MRYIINFFLLVTTILWGQDSTSVKRHSYKVWVRPSISINYLSIDVEDRPYNEVLGNKKLLPNYPLTAGLGAGIDNTYISFDYSKNIMPLRNVNTYGKTTFFDFQLHSFLTKKLLLDFYYQNYKGFYYEDKSKVYLLTDTQIQQVGTEVLFFKNWKQFPIENVFSEKKTVIEPLLGWYVGGGVYYHKAAIPLESFENTDIFRHLQAGISGGITLQLQLSERVSFWGLGGLGAYFGGELSSVSRLKVKDYMNFRVYSLLSYTHKNWALEFSVLYNNKRLYFKNSDLMSINSETFKLSYIRRLKVKSKYKL